MKSKIILSTLMFLVLVGVARAGSAPPIDLQLVSASGGIVIVQGTMSPKNKRTNVYYLMWLVTKCGNPANTFVVASAFFNQGSSHTLSGPYYTIYGTDCEAWLVQNYDYRFHPESNIVSFVGN